MQLTGYLRGQTLSVNRLVHLPGYGDFQLSQVDALDDPYPLQQRADKQSRKGQMQVGLMFLFGRTELLDVCFKFNSTVCIYMYLPFLSLTPSLLFYASWWGVPVAQ